MKPELKAARFTPAYAGNTVRTAPSAHDGEVHPRIRGEYNLFYS